ncbi:MAG: hypothetical protein PVH19_06100, partial [Planctomycetia bacterium]
MRIENPQQRIEGDTVVLKAAVHCDGAGKTLPKSLWFRYPASWQPMLYQGIEPFITALGPLAAHTGESIDVDLPVSEKLHANLEEYWTIFSQWFPKLFHTVQIHCPDYHNTIAYTGDAVGSAFSGGVDAFFTLFRHAESRHPYPHDHVTHGLFIHGFDIPLDDHRTFEIAKAAYEPALASMGVSLIPIQTNLRQFLDVITWDLAHGSALCGTAMTLSAGLHQFLVPSSFTYTTLRPWGSDPMIDPLLSTESL